MFNKLYDNCFKSELNTKIIKVEEENGLYWHACKDTIFYVGNGKMSNDIGMMDNHMVLGLKKQDGYVWHLLDVKLEGSVFMSINLHERFRKCQIHTAQHLINAVLRNVYKVDNLSSEVTDETCALEYNFADFNDKMAVELQVLCNGLIRDDLTVSILYPSRAEASQFLSSKELINDNLRVVRIGALDYVLCDCIQVPSLRYLQMIYIRGYEKTEHGYKIFFLVGDQLLDCVDRRYKVMDEISHELATPHLYLNAGVSKLVAKTNELKNEVQEWKEKYYLEMAEAFAQRKETAFVEQVEGCNEKSLVKMAQKLSEEYGKTVILWGKEYDTALLAIASTPDSSYDVKAMYETLKETYRFVGSCGEQLAYGKGIYKDGLEADMRALLLEK